MMSVENGKYSDHKNDGLQPRFQSEPMENGKEETVPIRDKSVWLRLQFKERSLKWAEVIINPIVTFLSLAVIIAFVLWSILNSEKAKTEFGAWQAWIGKSFTWLYIGSQDVWGLFIIYIVFSKYSSIRLGKPDSRPEYSDGTWFAMLFSCGVSTGLFFFGVAEPVYHYTVANRYSADPTLPDNTLAQNAILITLYHWGLHGWVVYTIIGLVLGLMAHREGLPMTMKSCFYPLIGDKIFGWPGDLIDILSVIATMFGVCTSLGLGTIQMNEGLNMLNSDIEIKWQNQVIIIWAITSIATISVVTGVKHGIRRISEFCFGCGCLLMLVVLFLDHTVFLLNLYVQSIGHYFQWLIQIGFHSDAFEQLGPSKYGAEDRGRYIPPGFESTDGPSTWMNNWTIFYWGWWIAWCPFVGMFIAKISYGRTIKEFIIGTMAAPCVYIFMWMIIFGGAGIRMEREAAKNDLCCHNIMAQNLSDPNGVLNDFDISTPMGELQPEELNDWCTSGACNNCSFRMFDQMSNQSKTVNDLVEDIKMVGALNWGYTTPDRHLTRLSCRKVQQMWFDLMFSYGDLGRFLSGFSLMSLILYFVTSSDSGSLIIDCLASNGYPEPPALQRIVWAVIEGLTATSLLVAGGTDALNALQSVSIATGLVYTILMCIACISLWRAIKNAFGEGVEQGNQFKIGVLDPLITDPLKDLLKMENRSDLEYKLFDLFPRLVVNIFTAPFSLAKAAGVIDGPGSFLPNLVVLYALLALIIIFHALSGVVEGFWALAWISYITFAYLTAGIRANVRSKYNIEGSGMEDFLLSLFIYPAVALQITVTMEEDRRDKFDWRQAFKMEAYRSPKEDMSMKDVANTATVNTVFESDQGFNMNNIPNV